MCYYINLTFKKSLKEENLKKINDRVNEYIDEIGFSSCYDSIFDTTKFIDDDKKPGKVKKVPCNSIQITLENYFGRINYQQFINEFKKFEKIDSIFFYYDSEYYWRFGDEEYSSGDLELDERWNIWTKGRTAKKLFGDLDEVFVELYPTSDLKDKIYYKAKEDGLEDLSCECKWALERYVYYTILDKNDLDGDDFYYIYISE